MGAADVREMSHEELVLEVFRLRVRVQKIAATEKKLARLRIKLKAATQGQRLAVAARNQERALRLEAEANARQWHALLLQERVRRLPDKDRSPE